MVTERRRRASRHVRSDSSAQVEKSPNGATHEFKGEPAHRSKGNDTERV